MNGGGSNEERSAEKLMDDHLKSLGLQRKRIAKDGSCLFRAVAEQVLHCQNLHTKVRAQCVEFLRKNRELYEAFIEGDFKDYLDKLKDPQQWVGEVEINALAVLYRRDFLIYQEPGKSPVNITDNNFTDTVQLCFLNGNHYDSVYPIDHIKNSALCQSILYELLYERVFKVDYSLLGTVQRVPRPSDLLIDDNMATCGTSDESDPDVGERLRAENESTAPRHNRGRGRGRHFPERVRRSLNPTLYRNIEYDVWLKSKKAQQRMDYCIAAGMQFTAGDRCQVCLEGSGRSYSATVKEVPPNNGLVTVYIEELGRKQVPLWSLRPPTSEENSWSTVVNRDKRLSDGHRDWEERGKGRGRGKHIPPAKQHSWPPEASLRQGAVSSNRFLSSVEAPVGLEKEHLANQEELRNVAPVEILLGDEHSFPALGDDGGRRKGADRRRSQGIKTKSPGDDSRDPPSSVGETPKSSTPPSADYPPPTSASAKPPTDPFPLQDSAANMKTPPTSPASATKTDTPSYATAAGATPIMSPAAASAPPSTKLSFPCGAVPSATVYLTPVLPTAAFSPLPNTLSSSSSPPPSSLANLANFLPSSFPPKSSPSPPSSSSPTLPTFIAPIAPHPSSRPHSPCLSPSLSSVTSTSFPLIRHAVGVQKVPTRTPHSLTNVGGSQTFQNPLPQTQTTSDSQTHFIAVPHVVSAPNIQPQSQSEVPVVQSSHPTLETSCPGPSHPFQIPHSSLSLSASLTPNNQTEDPPSHTVPQLHLPHPQSIPGAVPLQQMSQLYQDPLYPGFPLGEKGDIASIPSFSSSKLGDDLPNDINILRFFFNLGIKAYSMPMFSPYIYLLPLQQAHTMQLKLPSQSLIPPPHFPPSNPANRHQDGYPQLQYLPTSASVSSQHEPPPTSEAMYPVTDSPAPRLPWQQQQMPPHRNPTYPGTYLTPYPHPQILSQGYQLYPSSVPGYPPPLLGYQTSSGPEGGPRGAIEPHQPPNDPGSSLSNSNNKMSAPGLALRNQQGDSLTRSLLLVNPPHNNPILVSMPGVNHVPVSMTMMRTNNSPGSPSCSDFISNTSSTDDHFSQGYHGHQSPTNTYVSPASSQVGHSLSGAALPSVGCNTEDDWTGVKPPAYNHIGQRRGRRGRGGYDPGRGSNRRYVGETGLSYVQYNRGRRYWP